MKKATLHIMWCVEICAPRAEVSKFSSGHSCHRWQPHNLLVNCKQITVDQRRHLFWFHLHIQTHTHTYTFCVSHGPGALSSWPIGEIQEAVTSNTTRINCTDWGIINRHMNGAKAEKAAAGNPKKRVEGGVLKRWATDPFISQTDTLIYYIAV